MYVFDWLIAACWAVFIIVWAYSAVGAKRNKSVGAYARGFIFRVLALIIVIVVLHFFVPLDTLRSISTTDTLWRGILGVALCAIGIAFAVWARVYLGRNWGMPMSVKESPELVVTGPYAYVRHPIYTGVILGMLGSALVAGWIWLIVALVAAAYFIWSATHEEKQMEQTFPDAYPAYKKRTKMLIPFVL